VLGHDHGVEALAPQPRQQPELRREAAGFSIRATWGLEAMAAAPAPCAVTTISAAGYRRARARSIGVRNKLSPRWR
jgi:hypothetical protein